MISDCAVEAPEKYLFRVGLITTGLLLWVGSIFMTYYQKKLGGQKISDSIALTIVTVACFCLCIVGAVNEKEDNTVHSASAVVFFVGYLIYMTITTIRLSMYYDGALVVKSSIVWKIAANATMFVALLLFVLFNAIGMHNLEALCEWIATYMVMVYNLSFRVEYSNILRVATLFEYDSDESSDLEDSPLCKLAEIDPTEEQKLPDVV